MLSKYHLTQSKVDELIECNYSAAVMRMGVGGEAFSLVKSVLLPVLLAIFFLSFVYFTATFMATYWINIVNCSHKWTYVC